MRIQFNTTELRSNQTLHITEKDTAYFTALIASRLEHYKSNISLIKVHISHVDNAVGAFNGSRCALSTTVADDHLKPIICESENNNVVLALLNAIDTLTPSLLRSNTVSETALYSDDRIYNTRIPLTELVLP